jgi:ADP-ribose pyrophosphatase YjhB (NUDIX family)
MDNLETTNRNAVRAIILRDKHILLQKKTDGCYSLPGGAPNVDETLEQGLVRECHEEIGAAIDVIRLAHVGDYFKPRKSHPPAIRHHIEFFFLCSVAETYQAKNGHHPDKRQIGVEWLNIENLQSQNFVPASIIPVIIALAEQSVLPTYLGLI